MLAPLLIVVLIAAVFLAGASLGHLLLRVQLARLERRNLELDQKRLTALARAFLFRARAQEREALGTEQEVRREIDRILSRIEQS